MTCSDTDLEAVIIGAGPSGISAACQLQRQLGLSKLKIFERGTDFGGTWANNRYAGAACDVPPRLYSLSFYQKTVWKDFMAKQPEMEEYLKEVATVFKLYPFAQFQSEVYSAEWVEDRTHWRVKWRSVGGDQEHGVVTTRVLINGSGALSVPRDCDVEGWQSFKGPLFHSAKWDTSVDLTGKNVVVLGNGCSATQIVPSIAKRAKSVTQIVRAKHWYAPTPEDPFKAPAVRWLERNLPGFIKFERSLFSLFLDIHFIQAWNREGKAARDRFAANSKLYVSTVAPQRYHHLLIPTQQELQVACKRRVFDDAYIPSLNLDNVDLTNDAAVRITQDSVILKSGRTLNADVIILASGFKSGETAIQMKVTGRNGRELNQVWHKAGAPQAYRSTLCHDFPNFFLLWGPNSVTGHFSAMYTIESSVRFMCTVLRPIFLPGRTHVSPLERSKGRTVDVREEAQEKEDAMIRHQMRDLIYTSGCSGWYTNSNGRVSTLYPGFQMTFAWRSDHPLASDLEYSNTSANAGWSYPKLIASWFRLGDVPEYRKDRLAKRGVVARWLLDPVWRLVGKFGVTWLLAVVWFADKVMFYTRGRKEFELVKQRYLAQK